MPEKESSGNTPLNTCSGNSVRRKQVFQNSPGSEKIDVLYFDSNSQRDQQNLARYKRGAIAYNYSKPSGEEENLFKDMGFWGIFARKIGVRCLPTRAHYIIDGDKRFLEIIEGEDAWK